MVVRIRLARFGRKNMPFYRIFVADSRAPRDGKHLEVVGHYDPLPEVDGNKHIGLKIERIKYWISVGAQPSDTVAKLLGQAGILPAPPKRGPHGGRLKPGQPEGTRDSMPRTPTQTQARPTLKPVYFGGVAPKPVMPKYEWVGRKPAWREEMDKAAEIRWQMANAPELLEAGEEAAAERVAPRMNPQGISNTLWSVLTLAATRGVPLPACYPSLWLAASGLDVDSFKRVELCALFQAHLMHTELVNGDVRGEVSIPPWVTREARDAWMRDAQEDMTVSRLHREVADILDELGVRHEVEHLTDDGYFSVDVYLPDGDVALEIDGPSHFINITDGGGNASRSSTRAVRTELRDMFLARRHQAVVCVPWFEWAELRGRAEKRHYVAEKLRGAGVHVPSLA